MKEGFKGASNATRDNAKIRRHPRLLAISSAVLALLFFPTIAGAHFTDKDWTRWREILLPDKAAPAGHVLVDLDGEVFAASQTDLRDLRIAEEQGEEVPSKLIVQSSEAREEILAAEMIDRGRAPNGALRFTLDLGGDSPRHNRVELQTESTNFSRQVRIETSDDNRRWALVRDDGYIFDFSRDAEARYLEITYPRSSKRFLRVTTLAGPEKDFDIQGAVIRFSTADEAKRIEHPATMASNVIDPKPRARIVLLDLGHAKLPTSRIEIETKAVNFHRHVEIEGSNQPPESPERLDQARQFWNDVGRGEIYSIALDRGRRQKLEIDYTESGHRFLRIKIFHYDDAPIEITRIRVSGRLYSLLFQRQPGKSYRLYYGNAKAQAARYDLESLFPYIDLAKLNHFALGLEQRQAAAPANEKPSFEARPVWLWVTLGLAALLIGSLIYRLARMTTS